MIAGLQPAGLSHSEILGSKVICTYPRLIAAYHVLHRLREPRHPPCALSYFLRLLKQLIAQECSSYFQLLCDSKHFEAIASIIRMLILPINRKNRSTLQSCLCQYVKDLVLYKTVKWRITDSNR